MYCTATVGPCDGFDPGSSESSITLGLLVVKTNSFRFHLAFLRAQHSVICSYCHVFSLLGDAVCQLVDGKRSPASLVIAPCPIIIIPLPVLGYALFSMFCVISSPGRPFVWPYLHIFIIYNYPTSAGKTVMRLFAVSGRNDSPEHTGL